MRPMMSITGTNAGATVRLVFAAIFLSGLGLGCDGVQPTSRGNRQIGCLCRADHDTGAFQVGTPGSQARVDARTPAQRTAPDWMTARVPRCYGRTGD